MAHQEGRKMIGRLLDLLAYALWGTISAAKYARSDSILVAVLWVTAEGVLFGAWVVGGSFAALVGALLLGFLMSRALAYGARVKAEAMRLRTTRSARMSVGPSSCG